MQKDSEQQIGREGGGDRKERSTESGRGRPREAGGSIAYGFIDL